MWRSRMFWQLFLTCGGLVLSALTLLGLLITNRAEENQLKQTEETLRAKSLLVQEIVRGRTKKDFPELQKRLAALQAGGNVRISLMDEDGNVLVDSGRDPAEIVNQSEYEEMKEARRTGSGVAMHVSRTMRGLPMMYYAVRTDASPPVRYVRLALPVDVVQAQAAEMRRLVWTAVALTGVLALVLFFWLARRVSLPLQDLTAGAEQIAAGDYGHRVYIEGKDEVGKLARAFNHMSERLAGQFAQIDQDRQQLRAVLSSMVEGVVAIDAQQRVQFANDRAAQLLEFQTRAAVGRPLWEVVRQRAILEVAKAAVADAQSHQKELSLPGPAGRSLSVRAGPLPGSRGAVLVLHDTSELRRLERLRQEFVANVSHELKTPLAVIKACTETLLDGAADDPRHRGQFLEQIDDHCERLNNLIMDLLSLARIESATEAFVLQPVPLDDVVGECLERHRPLVEGRGQELQRLPPTGGAVAAWADEEAVRQILDNLVDNAIKYTPKGGQIRVRWWAENGQACLEVQDTGVGIAEHDLPRVFERFYRVDKARSRELGGTGLGLAIVKHLTQAMQGSVAASSKVNQGSTFTVRLPRAGVG